MNRVVDDVVDTEMALVRTALRVGAVIVPLAGIIALAVRGPRAGLTAVAITTLVVAVFVSTGMSLRWAARRAPTMVQGVALGGALARLSLYGLLAVSLGPTDVVDKPTLAVTAPIAIVVLLAAEVRLLLTNRQLWMIDPDAGLREEGKLT